MKKHSPSGYARAMIVQTRRTCIGLKSFEELLGATACLTRRPIYTRGGLDIGWDFAEVCSMYTDVRRIMTLVCMNPLTPDAFIFGIAYVLYCVWWHTLDGPTL